MKQSLKIWILVAAMVLGGAIPPQVIGDNGITTQWCAQAKSKKKAKKKKNKNKAKATKAKKSSFYSAASQSTLTNKTPQQGSNTLLAVGIPKGVSNEVINYKAMRVNFNPSLRIPNCVAYELTATMVDMSDAPGHETRKDFK